MIPKEKLYLCELKSKPGRTWYATSWYQGWKMVGFYGNWQPFKDDDLDNIRQVGVDVPVSRAEALKISKETLLAAEQERIDVQEQAGREGE
jgi:hypothetical protein